MSGIGEQGWVRCAEADLRTKLPVEWNNAIHGAAKQEADAAGMVELDVEIAWARALGEIPPPAASLTPQQENAYWDEANDASAAKESRRRARLEKRIRAVFVATGRTWIPLLLFAQNSVSKQAVLEAAALGILKQRAAAHDFYRLVQP